MIWKTSFLPFHSGDSMSNTRFRTKRLRSTSRSSERPCCHDEAVPFLVPPLPRKRAEIKFWPAPVSSPTNGRVPFVRRLTDLGKAKPPHRTRMERGRSQYDQ